MFKFFPQLSLALLLLPGCLRVSAQDGPPPQQPGALEVSGRLKIDGKDQLLKRKRFYLFRGGLETNKELVQKLKDTETVSRDCFYCRTGASRQFISWLNTPGMDCESPYCREITTEDIAGVPEFQTAFQKGLRQFGNRPAIAQKWLTTNLPPALRDGFYRQRKSLLDSLLGGIKPLQTSMTDSVSVKVIFIDIPLNLGGKKSEKFLVSNLLSVEIGDKSYVWACEVELEPGKTKKLPLQLPKKTGCEIIVKNLPACAAGSCEQK